MRVPHEGKARFSLARITGRWIGNRSRRRNRRRARRPGGGLRSEVRTAAIPRAERQNVCVGERYRSAAADVAERTGFERLVVIAAPFVIVRRRERRAAGGGVVAVRIRHASGGGRGIHAVGRV